jgi:hypothetical protein
MSTENPIKKTHGTERAPQFSTLHAPGDNRFLDTITIPLLTQGIFPLNEVTDPKKNPREDTLISSPLQIEAPAAEGIITEPIILPTKLFPLSYEQNSYSETKGEQVPESVLEAAREEGDWNTAFWNMLVSEVSASGYTPPQGRRTEVLVLGCGCCAEGMFLNGFFGGGEFGRKNTNARVTGIDIQSKEIERAIQKNLSLDASGRRSLPESLQFITGDATKLDQYPQIPEQADVVVLRHQQISASEKVWGSIFKQALQRVTPEGIVICTSFSDVEHEMLLRKLAELDCQVVISKRNPHAKPLVGNKVSSDRNIAIVKRVSSK